MNSNDMNYVGAMYDAFQRGSKFTAERSALNLGISFQAAERVYQGIIASGKSGFQDFVKAMDSAFYSRFHADELKVEVTPVIHARWLPYPLEGRFTSGGECSNCGNVCQCVVGMNYCWNCGARMDEKEESV